MATKVEFRNRALKKIGKLSVGQTASSEDAADVEAIMDNLLEWLVVENASTWGNDPTLIPEESQEAFITLLADSISVEFSYPADKQIVLNAKAVNALSSLHKQSSALRSGEPIKAEYF